MSQEDKLERAKALIRALIRHGGHTYARIPTSDLDSLYSTAPIMSHIDPDNGDLLIWLNLKQGTVPIGLLKPGDNVTLECGCKGKLIERDETKG